MVGILNIQIKPVLKNKELNLKKINHFLKKNSDKNLDLVILPEFFSTGIDHEEFTQNPEDENGGETIDYIKELAKEFNTNIVSGTVIEKSNDKLYNTTFIINRAGETIAKYRKIHLYNYMGGTEGERITPGKEEIVAELDFGKIGVGICYDIRYPLHYKKLAKMGAQIIVLPTAWIVPNEIYNDKETLDYAKEMWLAINRTRAYDNMVYVVSCNQTKKINDKVSAIGESLIVSPTAQVLQNSKDNECAIYEDVDLSVVDFLKQVYPIANID